MRLSQVLLAYAALGTFGCMGAFVPKLGTDDLRVRAVDGAKRCSLASAQSDPLVTEWSASSKARLEALLNETLADTDRNAIAVQYSGCELRIVDQCLPSGAYDWSKTTLAQDTLEINDSDALYAKLPLGAAALEGALKRSGRLSVQTTAAGQIRLKRTSINLDATKRDPACAEATHLIASVSIGAFQMLSGGRGHASAGAHVTGLGGGAASTSSEEQLVRRAGDERSCAETADAAPHPGCRSPLQLFLLPIPDRTASSSLPPAFAEPRTNSVTARSEPHRPDKPVKHSILRKLSYILGGMGIVGLGGGTASYLVSNGIDSKIATGGYANAQEILDADTRYALTHDLGVVGLISGAACLGLAVPLFIAGAK